MVTVLIDSSNTNLSVGIARDGVLLDSTIYKSWQRQSEFMVLDLDKIV